jgi:hypothetical protein
VSSRKPVITDTRKRKLYKQPALTKLTPEAAKKMLEAKSIPGDRQAEKLFKEINRRLESR